MRNDCHGSRSTKKDFLNEARALLGLLGRSPPSTARTGAALPAHQADPAYAAISDRRCAWVGNFFSRYTSMEPPDSKQFPLGRISHQRLHTRETIPEMLDAEDSASIP